MKFTGKYEKIKPLYSLLVVFGLAVVAIPFRMYQHLNIIEKGTGFYEVIDWSVYLMYVLCALAIIVPYVLTTLAKDIPASKSPFKKNKFLGVSAFVFAAGIVFDVVSAISTFLLNARGLSAAGLSIMGTPDQAQLAFLLEGIFGIFATIYILVFGISFFDGRTTYSQYRFLALAPLFWAMCRIVIRFVRKIAYVNVSDLMLELFSLAFMLIFLLAFARISVALSNRKAMRSLFASGFVGAFFCIVTNVPRFLMILTGNAKELATDYSFTLCDFGFALFAIAYILASIMCARENDSKELVEEKKDEINEMETDDNFLSE